MGSHCQSEISKPGRMDILLNLKVDFRYQSVHFLGRLKKIKNEACLKTLEQQSQTVLSLGLANQFGISIAVDMLLLTFLSARQKSLRLLIF
jgi:hypothetical protein